MAFISAFQAEDGGSIPPTRSIRKNHPFWVFFALRNQCFLSSNSNISFQNNYSKLASQSIRGNENRTHLTTICISDNILDMVKNKKIENNFAFIDSQNLNLAINDLGWKLDFKRFRIYLDHKYKTKKAYIFIGYIPGNEKLYTYLQNIGYVVIFKPTIQNNEGVVKGNVDAELVLHTMIEYNNFSKAIIITGDGDFYCLIEHLAINNKLFKVGIPNKKKYSALLRKFRSQFFYIGDLKHKLEYKKR